MSRAIYAAALAVLTLTFPAAVVAGTLQLNDGAQSVEVSGNLDGLAVVGTEGGPRQRPQGLVALRFDGDLSESVRFHLEVRGRVGGTFEGAHAGAYNFVHTFQNFSPSLEASEGYLDLRVANADFRAGIQKFAWGKLDAIPPTDVVNPRDFHDPFVTEFEEAKIGIPALSGTVYPPGVEALSLSQLHLTLIYVPLAVPSRLPLLDERWFPANALPGNAIVLPKGAVEGRIDRILAARCGEGDTSFECRPPDVIVARDVRVPLGLRTANHRTSFRLDTGGIAFRLGGSWRGVDWDVYHYTGAETGPQAALEAAVATRTTLEELFIIDAPTVNEQRTLRLRLRGRGTLRQDRSTIHMTGADWSAVIGGATIRAEAAYFKNRSYLRVGPDLVSQRASSRIPISKRFVDRVLDGECSPRPCRTKIGLADLFPEVDSVEWGLGADYVVGNFVPLLQVNQIILLEPAPRLVIDDPETRLTAVARWQLLDERLEVELRSAYAVERAAWLVFPRVSYLLGGSVRVRVGYLALGGDPTHLIGQFGDNDEVVIQVRYSF